MERVYVAISSLSAGVVVPALILAFLLCMFSYVLWLAQKRPDFDAANFLRDDKGKEDIVKICTLIALAITSWLVSTLVFTDKISPEYFLYYSLTWASTPVLIVLASKWNGALPFAKGPSLEIGRPPEPDNNKPEVKRGE